MLLRRWPPFASGLRGRGWAWSQRGPLRIGAWGPRFCGGVSNWSGKGCWGWSVEVARSKGKLGRGRRGPPPFLHADLRWRVKPAECAQSQKTRRDTDTSTRLLECARTGVKQNLSGSSEMNGVTSSGGSLCWWTCVGRLARRFIIRHTCS